MIARTTGLPILLVSLLVSVPGQQEPTQLLDVERIVRLPVIHQFALSPHSSSIIVTISVLGSQKIYLIDEPGRPGQRLTDAGGAERDPDWAPDGKRVAFASNRSGRWRIYVSDLHGGEASPITPQDSDALRPRWSPDGQRIAYLSKQTEGRTGWDLWVVLANGSRPQQLTRDSLDEQDPRWSPDSRRLAFTFRAGRHVNRRIAVVASPEIKARSLLPPEWEGDTHSPRWAPDGKTLAFVSDQDGKKAIYTVSFEGGDITRLTTSEYEETEPVWSPDGASVAHVSNREGRERVMTTALQDRTSRPLTLASGVYRQPQWSSDGDGLAALYSAALYPADVWLYPKKGGRRRLTDSLPFGLDVRQMVRPELVRYPSWDGRLVTGFLYLPIDASPDKPVPLVVHPHGGPTSQWKDGWHPFVQLLAQRGYAIFAPNVRGSSGFGRDFENLNDRDWGRGDLKDLVAGARAVAKRPEVRDRGMGVWGVSYGGFLTLAAIGRYPDLFDCAVEAIGMPDLESLYRETNTEGVSYLERELGPLRGNLELYRQLSPVRAADRIKTPLLTFHAEDYPLVPYSTKVPMLKALLARSHPLEELVFKGQRGAATYRYDVFPAESAFYMAKILEFFAIHLENEPPTTISPEPKAASRL